MHTDQMNILINTIEKVANDKNMEEYEKKTLRLARIQTRISRVNQNLATQKRI